MKNVLWTGGWDSTYRVLDLVLNKKQKVQPYYIKDDRRKSTPVEINTMNKIKKMIFEINPDAVDLIKDTIIVDRTAVPENKEMRSYYEQLVTNRFLGSQYVFLASFVRHYNVKNLELSIHKDDKAQSFIKNDVELIERDNDSYYRLIPNPSLPELKLFSNFIFPLLNMSKLEMSERAKESGFAHIMEETWFCYNPLKDGKPCGVCNPCKYTREEGLGRRVPNPTLYRKLQVFILKAKHRIKKKLCINKEIKQC